MFAAPKQFTSGVTAGEITDDAAIIWGRTNQQRQVRAQVSLSNSFQNPVTQRTLQAVVGNNFTFQTRITRLQPNRTYYYRFCIPGGGGLQLGGQVPDRSAALPADADQVRVLG